MSIKFLVLGGGVWVWGGGGADFIFMGARIFLTQAKTEVALQFSACGAADVAMKHLLFCSADVRFDWEENLFLFSVDFHAFFLRGPNWGLSLS